MPDRYRFADGGGFGFARPLPPSFVGGTGRQWVFWSGVAACGESALTVSPSPFPFPLPDREWAAEGGLLGRSALQPAAAAHVRTVRLVAAVYNGHCLRV